MNVPPQDASFCFTQCLAVLFEAPPTLEQLDAAIAPRALTGRPNEGSGEDGWVVSGPGRAFALAGGAQAFADVVDRPWPDRVDETPALSPAYASGIFGPAAGPGALARALDQAWAWPEGAAAAGKHRAFVRLRTGCYLEGEPPELPPEHDPLAELTGLTEVAHALLGLPGALALFAPAGEALRSAHAVAAALQRAPQSPPPIELWTNLRAVALHEEEGVRWVLLDVVGLNQLRLPDQEAVFAEGREQTRAVETLLRNAALHLASGRDLPEETTARDGANRRWHAARSTAIVAPPRPVVRWLPEESARPSEAVLTMLEARDVTG
jgi:hypothetical protein